MEQIRLPIINLIKNSNNFRIIVSFFVILSLTRSHILYEITNEQVTLINIKSHMPQLKNTKINIRFYPTTKSNYKIRILIYHQFFKLKIIHYVVIIISHAKNEKKSRGWK